MSLSPNLVKVLLNALIMILQGISNSLEGVK